MGKKLTDAKREAIARYDKANTRYVGLKLNRKTDADILEVLEAEKQNADGMQGYIKKAIRAYIASR